VERTSHLTTDLPDADSTRALGQALAGLLQPGDLVMLTGDLGAGKTTLTQGIGSGLDVRGQVASPTFVIARVHPPLGDGPALVHVDAYRLGSLEEVDALDLDASLEESVTVVEWGRGLVESIARDRLEVTISRPRGTGDDTSGATAEALDAILEDAETGTRQVTIEGFGARWAGLELPGAASLEPTQAPAGPAESVG